MTAVQKGAEIAPAKGKLGVLLVGLGAVSTTFIAGVEAIKKGIAEPIGSLTQMGAIRLGKRTDNRVPLIKDFLPLVRHMHLKDWNGGEHYVGYCPLGMGKVDIKTILDLVEGSGNPVNVMVELDPSARQPMTPLETAQTSKAYLQKLGYTFRS